MTSIKILTVIVILSVFAAIGAFCWPYALNEWLVFFDKEPTIVWWQGAILGFVPFVGKLSIPFAVITWMLMLFLV